MTTISRLRFFLFTYFRILSKNGIKDSFRLLSDYGKLRKNIREKISAVIEDFKTDSPGVAYQKYLDVNYWVFESLRRAYLLGLHRDSTGKAILDLGTGAGYFPFICNYYGHTAEALDVPDNEMYNRIIQGLGIRRYTQYIQAFKDLELNGQYDLVTGFMICFNNHKTPAVWHIEEWDYFLKAISNNNLRPKGRIYLSLNGESKEEPINRELLAYFSTINAEINRENILIKREQFLNT